MHCTSASVHVNRDDELSRDERDAVSAEELLRRLKGEMEFKGETKSRSESLVKEDSHISDEAEKTAREEIALGDPDEFGDDLEALVRMVMDMPAEEAESDDGDVSEAAEEAADNILNMFAHTKTNEEFVQTVKKTRLPFASFS